MQVLRFFVRYTLGKGGKKLGSTSAIALVVGFYTTFVAQSLWNWFAVKAFGVPSVSYWEMYGLSTLLGLLFAKDGEEAKNFGGHPKPANDGHLKTGQREN